MIYYNSNTINEWNFGDDNIIKVYKHGAVCYYKITSGDTPTPEYKVCFAVVDDITQYQETEFEDVYDKATEKWYKLNNLNQYEEYGVYGDGRNITYYEGKLTIDTESSKLPSGYTEVEYITSEHLSINLNTGTYINTNYYPTDKTRVVIDYQATSSTAEHRRLFGAGHCCKNNIAYVLNMEQKYTASNREFTYRCGSGNTWVHTNIPFDLERHVADFNNDGAIYIDNTQIGTRQNAPFTATYPMYLLTDNNDGTVGLNQYIVGRVYSCQMYEDGTKIRDFVPAQRDSDSKYGLYDIVNDVFYPSSSNYSFSGGAEVTTTNEYIYSGSSWVNLGEVSGSSRVPIGYTEVEYIENTSTAYINTGFKPNQDTRIVAEMQTVTSTSYGRFLGAGSYNRTNAIQFDYETGSNGTLHVSWGTVAGWTTYSSCVGDYNKHTYDWNKNEFYRDNTLIGSVTYGNFQCTDYLAIFGNILNGTGENFMYGKMYSFQMYDNGTLIRDLVPCKMDSDNKYGAYDIVNNVFYTSPNGVNFIGGSETGSTEYPKYYTEKSDPLDDLTFNTLAEAQTYAYNNCVYDGMKAIIDGDRYYFDSSDENGWVRILEYYKVEDVTPSGASGWTISGSDTYNPDSSYYDDFDLQTTSTTASYKIAKVTIYGYDHFTYYLRTYNGYSTLYAYAIATNVDEIQTPPSTMPYNTTSAITNTYDFSHTAGSEVNLGNYRRVTYNNLDKTVEHTFYVVFHGRTYLSYKSDATILIPKEQTNENWEQVTFSASSNVASAQKTLYIDNNNSSSGGTSYWYYRWIIGLPSGSHTSHTSYFNYNYCPNTTSSTFTSVAGEQRQVNFTYDNTTNKTLSFRLVDGNGNVLTPSDTVYYNMALYNSCNVSSSSSNSFPRSQSVKVGGSFSFSNSYDRHYIYGYQPPTLTTRYYVDNYQNTFDIVYTKLNDEAVTITYTTYDPSDTEVPSFKTDITYPYSGGTTSSTTLASYAVPYTYPYTVKQINDKFSADSQTYTANQAARTISFILYPNYREFATVADMEAYAYAWEGMKANVGDTNYKYKNGEWVEETYTQYEYIRTQNAATIFYDFVTNFKPTNSHTIEVKVEFVDRSNNWGHILSWNDGTSSHGFSFLTVTSSYQAIVRTGGNNGVSWRPTIGANKPTVFTLPLSAQSGTYSVNGGSEQTIQYNYSTMTLPANIGMCFFGQGTTSRGKAAVAKMYYVKVYDGSGNIVKHYVPSDYNGTPCFYEIVDGEYIMDTYTGSNHGTLTLGPKYNSN